MGICMAVDCKQKSRLMCFCCSTGEHYEHAKSVVKISDLNKDLLEVKNWPKDDIAVEVKKLIQQNIQLTENGLELVDKIFE
jgi:hypothetical protein